MDWEWSKKKNWSIEDQLYARKREVTNKGSHEHEHLIGAIYSSKMKRSVQYESLWGECIFYYLLELYPLMIRYYEQPVFVATQKQTKGLLLKDKGHVPDVLTFREGSRPHLYQLKGGNSFIEQNPMLYAACMKYALEQGWDYSVVHPKIMIPANMIYNIEFLINFLEPRYYYNDWLPEMHYRIGLLKKTEIYCLAKSFEPKIDHRYILPIIYHLIAIGILITDISKKIDHKSEVSLGSIFQGLYHLFTWEDKTNEIM
jgi:hypothetical protein